MCGGVPLVPIAALVALCPLPALRESHSPRSPTPENLLPVRSTTMVVSFEASLAAPTALPIAALFLEKVQFVHEKTADFVKATSWRVLEKAPGTPTCKGNV